MKQQIEFLKGLAKEMKEQPTDYQAAPRFWAIRDYRVISTSFGNSNGYSYYHNDGDFTEFESYEELKDFLDEHYNLSERIDKPKTDNFGELWEWTLDNLNDDGYFMETPTVKEGYIVPNTLFLTKKEALKHLENNAHHYTKDAHTYAMTAWRSPEFQQLLEIIETFDWDKVDVKGGAE